MGGCGVVGGTSPNICFNRSQNKCSQSQNVNCLNTVDATFTVQRQNIFDLIV